MFGDGVFAEAVDPAALRAGATTLVVVDDNLEIDLTSGAIARLLLRHMLPRFHNLLSGAE